MSTRKKAARLGALAAAGALLLACGGSGSDEDRLPRRITVPAGTELRLTLERELGTDSVEEGERFTARVAEPVAVAGHRAVPAGAVVYGRVVGVRRERAGAGPGSGILRITFQTVRVRGGSPILSARVLEVEPAVRSGGEGTRIPAAGGGPAGGPSVGEVLPSGRRGTGVGRAMGTDVVLDAGGVRAVLPEGSGLRVELVDPLRVRTP